jgi:hypothetical protein
LTGDLATARRDAAQAKSSAPIGPSDQVRARNLYSGIRDAATVHCVENPPDERCGAIPLCLHDQNIGQRDAYSREQRDTHLSLQQMLGKL